MRSWEDMEEERTTGARKGSGVKGEREEARTWGGWRGRRENQGREVRCEGMKGDYRRRRTA